MRRILIALMVSGAVAVVVPTGALAQHHHSRHHARHHSRIRHQHFVGRDTTQPGSSGQAGTVSSFTDNGNGTGVLTITLANGSTVTGNVTGNTQLECISQSATTGDDQGDTSDSQGSSSDDQGDTSDTQGSSGDDQGDSSDQGTSGSTQGSSGDDQGDNGDDQGDNGGQPCSTSALVATTPVEEANLEITSSGAVWNTVVLMTP